MKLKWEEQIEGWYYSQETENEDWFVVNGKCLFLHNPNAEMFKVAYCKSFDSAKQLAQKLADAIEQHKESPIHADPDFLSNKLLRINRFIKDIRAMNTIIPEHLSATLNEILSALNDIHVMIDDLNNVQVTHTQQLETNT